MEIDHNPNEKRPPRWFWWAVFAALALLWIVVILTEAVEWSQVALGLGTGALVAGWAMELTGGEVPSSWRSKTPRR